MSERHRGVSTMPLEDCMSMRQKGVFVMIRIMSFRPRMHRLGGEGGKSCMPKADVGSVAVTEVCIPYEIVHKWIKEDASTYGQSHIPVRAPTCPTDTSAGARRSDRRPPRIEHDPHCAADCRRIIPGLALLRVRRRQPRLARGQSYLIPAVALSRLGGG